jgi:hypothetical protein
MGEIMFCHVKNELFFERKLLNEKTYYTYT